MRSRKVEPCAAVMRTLSQSETTSVPPVTADRSPPDSANNRSGLSRNGRLVDRGDALDHLAVGGNQVAGFDEHDLTDPKLACRSRHDQPLLRIDDELGHGFFTSSDATLPLGPCRGPPPRLRRNWRTGR